MAQTSAEQIRAWQGPALLSYGFRPFFLLGALWAATAMALWIPALAGAAALPTHLDPVSWHAHAFLFGYLGAVIGGFLLTAVPNWTGGLPVVGWRLGALVTTWAAGRAAVLVSAHLPLAAVAAVDLAFPLALGAVLLREIVAGRNWRNLPVLGLLAAFALANAIFHAEAAGGAYAAGGIGLRLGLAAVVLMIAMIGGRIVPSFTRNWLVRAGSEARPAAPMGRFDKLTLMASVAIPLTWVAAPASPLTAAALSVFAALHIVRLARWQGHRTGAEPLVWVLHAAYAMLPLGALALALAILWPAALPQAAAQHVWMAGALGLMTLAVMTRATLGHTGRALVAGPGTVAIYAALIGSVVLRLAAGPWPGLPLLEASALAWLGAFGGYAALYGPMLWRAKPEART